MLLNKQDTIDSLRCPKSGSKLIKVNDRLIAEFSTKPIEYEFVGDCPVLIDFEKGILKKEGIEKTPFLQHVHEGAYDFTRYTESGHRYLFKNFELISSGSCGGAGTQLLWSIDNFVRGVVRSRKVGKVIKLGFFWLQYFVTITNRS
jgi:hypothetical protein